MIIVGLPHHLWQRGKLINSLKQILKRIDMLRIRVKMEGPVKVFELICVSDGVGDYNI